MKQYHIEEFHPVDGAFCLITRIKDDHLIAKTWSMEDAREIVVALEGARKPSKERVPEVGDVVAWDALKKLAEEQFEVRAKHAREGKQAGIEAGDTSEVQCFACELQMLTRGFGAWLMAYHLMRRAGEIDCYTPQPPEKR